ncbi:MAG: PLP-dependent aminotransferase family protein [Sporomusaceae bacterium]|nr:PLP-dependent aminotransferase family protein [Sporomusaceae bacterium]
MLLLELQEKSPKPQYQQILEQIRHKIEARILHPGEKLPSTRRLADSLGIHRSTVASAYQELWALGFIDMKPNACPIVRDRMQIATAASRQKKGRIDWSLTASTDSSAIWDTYRGFQAEAPVSPPQDFIDFSGLDMDCRLFPLETFRSCFNQAMKREGFSLLSYGDRAGFFPLRTYLAHHLQSHGISVTAEEILITNGLQQGIDLVFRMIAAPGKAVAIESPTYKEMLPLLKFCGLKPLEIPIRSDGMDLAILEKMLKTEQPSLVYTMPNFQNPTGVTTSQSHREKLLSLCQKYGVPILEDGFEEEMKYFGRVVLPIKSMDDQHTVIYCGTFSKVLFPGVRIGWIAAEPECIERLMAIRSFSDLSSSMILQAAIYEFCQRGHYDRHISKMHRLFRKRMQTALVALKQYIKPEWAAWSEPNGGYLLWLKLSPLPDAAADLTALFAKQKIQISSGKYFFSSSANAVHLRLSISKLNEAEITEGIKRLALALEQIYH